MTNNLKQLSFSEQQFQLESRKNYTFFNDGYLDGNAFAFWLFESLWLDNFKVGNPVELLDALWIFVKDEHLDQRQVYETHITDMTPEAKAMYPQGKTTLFHFAFFIPCIHDYIAYIGEAVIRASRRKNDRLYSWWIKHENVYTYMYLDTFMRQLSKFLNSLPNFRSAVMDLHISRHIPNNKQSAALTLIKKEDRSKRFVERISGAINQRFYLEAIALEESCISDRLSLVLYSKGKKADTKSFAKLIELCGNFMPSELKHSVDSWRKDRNRAIHNLVRSSPLDELVELEELDSLASDTAKKGLELLHSVNAWFDEFTLSELNPFAFRLADEKKLN
ncbi:hypothetical protein AB4376_18750 [Vibrio breoganii]